jgi:predicted DNA-binding transcriptional regulator YafY
MNRLNRLTALLLLLQTRRVITSEQLADRFEVSRRTVYRDIRVLEEAGVPILSEAGVGYCLAGGYHLPPVMFTREQAGALITAGKLMEQFSDAAISQSYQGALDKIRAVLDQSDQRFLERLENRMTVRSPLPSPPPGQGDGHMLSTLQALLANQRVAVMTYHSGWRDEVTERAVEPLVLCFYAAHWHLLAYCRLRGAYRDFRVDRIRSLTPTESVFDAEGHGGIDQLIERMVKPTDLKPALVRFSKDAAAEIRENRYYWGFVREEAGPEGIDMHFLTPHYDYLTRWLMGFCDQVLVLSPPALKERMQTFVRRLHRHYCSRS